MASILRSSKFVRYIAGFARNVVINTPREFDGNLVNSSQCLCSLLPKNLATQASTLTDQTLESSLRRIDQDVRKSGRISRRDIEDVLEEIRNSRSATSSQSLLVIRCCGNLVPEELPETRTKLVQEIWNTLNKLNIPMDISHYNALLRVYLENEYSFSPTEFLSELENKGIEPNRVTYQRLIARYCQEGDIEGATKILEYMREKQMSVNENVFNALIFGHANSGDMESAEGILNVMHQAGLEPSADTYTTLLCSFAAKGDIDKIAKTIEECESKEVFLLDKDYLDIVYSLATNNHGEHIPVILEKVRKAVGYNQDAINIILRLVNKGQEEAAYLVLKSMPRGAREDSTPLPTGIFFIKQLVKANRPINRIIEFCERLQREEMYERAFILAAETSLALGNDKLAYPLLEKLSEFGVEVRQHFFWPLIVSKAQDSSGREIIEVLKKMSQFNIQPNYETIREYVLPNLKGKKTGEILALLRDANVPIGTSACNLVVHLLQKNEISEAATLAGTALAYYQPDVVIKPLTNAFYRTGDMKSYTTIVRMVHDNLHRKALLQQVNQDDEGNQMEKVDKPAVVGSFILELASNKQKFLDHIEAVLEAFVEQGLSISNSAAGKIEEKLGEKMTENISKLLSKLSSGDLIPVPLERKPLSYIPSSQMNTSQLERLIHNLKAKNQEVKGLKRQLLGLYYRAKDLEKTEMLLCELQTSPEFVFTSGLYAQLVDLYAYHNRVEDALKYYNKLKELEGDSFTLDEGKLVRLSHTLTNNNRFDEAMEILEKTPIEKKEERNFSYNSLLWRFFNSLAESGKHVELDKVFELLLRKGLIDVNNVLLGPFIKVHLIRDDVEEALKKFEWCVNQFNSTPWKNELACKLIQAEDAEKLQKLTDLSTVVHGEVNSLYDLVFAFVECGRMRQARKILETPGLANRPQRINSACARYQHEGLIKPLEDLKEVTKDLNHIDRSDIYYQLLLGYIKQDEPDKALGLWTQMQEEDLAPTDQFLATLGLYLKEKNLQVPFVIPQETLAAKRVVESNPQALFRKYIKNNNLDAALQMRKSNAFKCSEADLSNLVEKLLQANRVMEGSVIVLEMLERKKLPVNKVFRFLLNKLASNGNVDTLEKIGNKVSTEEKKIISFDNRMCHAYLVAGRVEEYLQKLDDVIDKADESTLSNISEQFPRGGAFGILEKHPEHIGKFEAMAMKYATKGILGPLNVFWSHLFVNGDDDKAEQIWSQYLKDSSRIMFQKIVLTAREKQDEELAKKLIQHLKISKVTEGAIGNAYSCLLDVLVTKEKDKEVVETFERAAKEVPLNTINRTAMLRTKEVYKKLGKSFEYTMPAKTKNRAQVDNEGLN